VHNYKNFNGKFMQVKAITHTFNNEIRKVTMTTRIKQNNSSFYTESATRI
jgi:hypothetical protein